MTNSEDNKTKEILSSVIDEFIIPKIMEFVGKKTGQFKLLNIDTNFWTLRDPSFPCGTIDFVNRTLKNRNIKAEIYIEDGELYVKFDLPYYTDVKKKARSRRNPVKKDKHKDDQRK